MMQMVRDSRARHAEGIAPRITRIYTYGGGGWLRERRAVWLVAVHWRGFDSRRLDSFLLFAG